MNAWITYLSGERRIDFISPLSLEKCLGMLEDAESTALLSSPRTSIQLTKLDQNTFSFTISQSYPGRLGTFAKASGYLKRSEVGSKTHVVGRVEPDWFGLISLILIILLPLFLHRLTLNYFCGSCYCLDGFGH